MNRLYILLLIALLCTGTKNSIAQICTPDPAIGGLYIYPPVLTFATAGYYYSQVLTFRVPKDTFVSTIAGNIPAVIDSAKVLYIGGIPPGYYFACGTESCTWPGGSLGCGLLAGISDSNNVAVGEYPIKVYVGTWAHAATTPFYRIDSSSSYTFKVLPYTGGFELSLYEPLKAYPNPTQGNLTIELRGIETDNNTVQVIDAAGRIVYTNTFAKPAHYLSTQQVSLEQLPQGLYSIVLQTEKGNKQIRILRN